MDTEKYTLLCERRNAFETNSSSTHSLVIDKDSALIPQQEIDNLISKDGLVHISQGEFGWRIETYDDPMSALSYLYSVYTEDPTLANSDSASGILNPIREAVLKMCGCEVFFEPFKGYIDHESVYLPVIVLRAGAEEVIDFVFRQSSYFKTDNDNH